MASRAENVFFGWKHLPEFPSVPATQRCEGQEVPRSCSTCAPSSVGCQSLPMVHPKASCGSFAEGAGAEEHTGSVSLIPAGSQLPKLHKEPFHALHKQARGMKGCYRRASAPAAAQAGIPKITSFQKVQTCTPLFPCCWDLGNKGFR